jgi:nucleotide-binding universal stress UspA family protein
MTRSVIPGSDGSQQAVKAAYVVAVEACRRPAPLDLITAEAIVRQAAGAVSGPDVITAVCDGDPMTALTEPSADAQLVVLGSRAVGGVPGLLLGSTASGVVAPTRCPLTVAPLAPRGGR